MIQTSNISYLLSKLSLILFLSMSSVSFSSAQDLKKVMDLSHRWKFSIGDKQEWANPEFNDSDWEWIDVPSAGKTKVFMVMMVLHGIERLLVQGNCPTNKLCICSWDTLMMCMRCL
ncbi:hypothetical protein [Marinifilum fragile]|uniref:hypothetical protein n=1 Tax=Marinifilum fragile TaxID=570161 RepID=UPI0006CF5868|nr:hypothetical protein [Marinifilum fragile]